MTVNRQRRSTEYSIDYVRRIVVRLDWTVDLHTEDSTVLCTESIDLLTIDRYAVRSK